MSGQESLEDGFRSGRPKSVTTSGNILEIEWLVEEDPHITVEEIAMRVGMSTGAAHAILVDEMKASKICSRWIPHSLTDAQKDNRVRCARNLLSQYEHADPRRLCEIITGDESWIRYDEPLSKEKNNVWVLKGDGPPLNPRPDFRDQKILNQGRGNTSILPIPGDYSDGIPKVSGFTNEAGVAEKILNKQPSGGFGNAQDVKQKYEKNPELYYKMVPFSTYSGKKVGRGIIIVNEKFDSLTDRLGADKDREYFTEIYDKLGVDYENNNFYDQTANEMGRNLKNFTGHPSNKDKSVIFIAISSHGGSNGEIYCKNGTINLGEIFQYFYSDDTLLSIPKVFLIQACRGSEEQNRIASDGHHHQSHGIQSSNYATSTSDTLIVYATADGFSAWRDKENGSWFVKELRDCILNDDYKDLHLVDRLTVCTNLVISNHCTNQGITETPSYQSTLKKFLYFPPVDK